MPVPVRSEKIEALFSEGAISVDDLDLVHDEWVGDYIVKEMVLDVMTCAQELFEMGIELAVKAGGRPITYASADGVIYYFIGTEAEVLDRMAVMSVMRS